jgi:hypothetical protein
METDFWYIDGTGIISNKFWIIGHIIPILNRPTTTTTTTTTTIFAKNMISIYVCSDTSRPTLEPNQPPV